jgi:hypothetical protein
LSGRTNSLPKGIPESEWFASTEEFCFVEEGEIIYSPDDETKEMYLIVEERKKT